jgi:ribonuclease HI
LGNGTNDYVELMSLKLLMVFALEKDCKQLSVFGDSKNPINWINGTQIWNIKSLQIFFDFFSCQHVYRERNKEADMASRKSTYMEMGHWKITEFINKQTQEQHRTFL